MSYEKLIRIPSDRIGALIGKSGKSKKRFTYSEANINAEFNINQYYKKQETLKIIPGDSNEFDIELVSLPMVLVQLIRKIMLLSPL